MKYLVTLLDKVDELNHAELKGAKIGTSDLSTLGLGASELKTMIQTTKKMRKMKHEITDVENECNAIENIIDNLKSISFYHSNVLKAKLLND